MALPSFSVQSIEDGDDDQLSHDQRDDGDHRRQVDRAGHRQDSAPKPEVRLADVVEEPLHRPERVRQLDPRRQDVQEDDEHVDAYEDAQEPLDLADCVEQEHWRLLRGAQRVSYAWLKKPPRSSSCARCSADTSTFRGVRRNTLSATRCMPPSRAYVRPLAKSISRFDRSWSDVCRFRITGIESLNLSAICCASLKLLGTTRCIRTDAGLGTAATRGRGLSTVVRSFSGSGSVQSSNSRCRRAGVSRRTFGRSAYVRWTSSSVTYASSSQSSSSAMPK